MTFWYPTHSADSKETEDQIKRSLPFFPSRVESVGVIEYRTLNDGLRISLQKAALKCKACGKPVFHRCQEQISINQYIK